MNLWKAFWKCRRARHVFCEDIDRNVIVCAGCGLTISQELLEEVANGHRKGCARVGSGAGALQTPAPGECTGGGETGAGPSPEPVAQEIIAWRGWRATVQYDGFGNLDVALSGFTGVEWEGPTLVADAVPDTSNENGIYARPMDYYEQLKATRYKLYVNLGNPSPVQGTVALSGRVLQGERGWRAERATIRELWILGHIADAPQIQVQALLESRYKCDVHFGIPVHFPAWIYT